MSKHDPFHCVVCGLPLPHLPRAEAIEKGAKRIRKLQDSVLNLQMQVLEKQESIIIMDHEIAEIQATVGSDIGDKVQFIQDLTEKHGRY